MTFMIMSVIMSAKRSSERVPVQCGKKIDLTLKFSFFIFSYISGTFKVQNFHLKRIRIVMDTVSINMAKFTT